MSALYELHFPSEVFIFHFRGHVIEVEIILCAQNDAKRGVICSTRYF